MSIVRKNNQQEIVIAQDFDQAVHSAHAAGRHVGKVTSFANATGTLRVKVTKVPFVNPTTIRVSCESMEAGKTRVRIDSESLDGMIGAGSAGRSLDAFVDALGSIASGNEPKPMAGGSTKLLLAIAVIVAVCLAGLVISAA